MAGRANELERTRVSGTELLWADVFFARLRHLLRKRNSAVGLRSAIRFTKPTIDKPFY